MTPPTSLISVDPGLRGCGVAQFYHGVLDAAYYSVNPEKKLRGPTAWRRMAEQVSEDLLGEFPDGYRAFGELAVEVMQVRPIAQQKGRQSDLIEVAGVSGALTYLAVRSTGYKPEDWKGQVPKEKMGPRILKRLAPHELEVWENIICPASLKHNVLDAIGIGLFHLGRLSKHG